MWFIFGSFFFDLGDGMVARAMKVASPIGRELDSLADVVSFGVVPGAMLYGLLASIYCASFPGYFSWAPASAPHEGPLSICAPALPAFILSLFSAFRLAKFNLDVRQRDYFVGLSTPGCTVFVMGLTLAARENQWGIGTLLSDQPWILYGVIGVFSYLLVSEIPMFGLKFRSFRWQGNQLPYIFLALALALLIVLKGLGLLLLILFYIGFSIVSKDKIILADHN